MVTSLHIMSSWSSDVHGSHLEDSIGYEFLFCGKNQIYAYAIIKILYLLSPF